MGGGHYRRFPPGLRSDRHCSHRRHLSWAATLPRVLGGGVVSSSKRLLALLDLEEVCPQRQRFNRGMT